MQLKALLPFQLFSALSASEILLPIVPQHMLLNVVLVKTQLAKVTLPFDISAPIILALNSMHCKLMLHQQFMVGKC